MTARAYGKGIQHLAKADYDWDTIALKAMICTSTYTPNFDTDEFRSSVTGEVSGAGYTAGGVALTSELLTLDTTNHRVKMNADAADFGTVTFTGGVQLIVYVDTGSLATDILISNHTFTSQSPSAVPWKYQFHVDGIGYIAY